MSLNDYPQSSPIPNAFTSNDLEMNGRAIQDQVAQLLSGRASHVAMRTPPPYSPPASHVAFPLVDSAESLRPLQLKLEALQAENDQLKALAEARKNGELESVQRAQSLQEDRDRAVARTAELETSVKTAERALSERTAQIEGLERAVAHAAADVEKAKSDGEARLRDLQSRLDDKESLMKDLKGAIEAKEAGESETNAALKAKNAEIALLEARVQKAYAELEEERRELGGQVDELRQAGQVLFLPYTSLFFFCRRRRLTGNHRAVRGAHERRRDQALRAGRCHRRSARAVPGPNPAPLAVRGALLVVCRSNRERDAARPGRAPAEQARGA